MVLLPAMKVFVAWFRLRFVWRDKSMFDSWVIATLSYLLSSLLLNRLLASLDLIPTY